MGRHLVMFGISLLCMGLPQIGAAQILSPGPLSQSHADLEGLTNCLKCHSAGNQIDAAKCLSCHKELNQRIERTKGFHGRMQPDDRQCVKCHREHKGREISIIDWGAGGQTDFDHDKTGYPLVGGHQGIKCVDCHKPAFVVDRAVLRLIDKNPDNQIFLGLTERCDSCHEDVHHGDFGKNCKKCHTETSWVVMKGQIEDRSFHDKHRFKLVGRHQTVACQKCHGPFPGLKAKFRGVPFENCADCHFDAHMGQMTHKVKNRAALTGCEDCHREKDFVPAVFDLAQHQKTDYPLEGGHQAVACQLCHVEKRGQLEARIPSSVEREINRKGRKSLFSFAQFQFSSNEVKRCETCHRSAHDGQFTAVIKTKGCAHCHQESSFHNEKFDHNRDSDFPLTGKHTDVACADCHPTYRTRDGRDVVKYEGVSKQCAACHFDVHMGQFATRRNNDGTVSATGKIDCDKCHTTKTFKEQTFDHNDPKFTDYPLEGAHARVACEACHPPITVATGTNMSKADLRFNVSGSQLSVQTRRYTPMPKQCHECHVDNHEGAFRGLAP